MTAKGSTLNLNGKWGASVTRGIGDECEYFETRYSYDSEEMAKWRAEDAARALWVFVEIEWA